MATPTARDAAAGLGSTQPAAEPRHADDDAAHTEQHELPEPGGRPPLRTAVPTGNKGTEQPKILQPGEKMASLPIETVMERLHASTHGLGDEEAARRLALYGPNALPSSERRPLLIFLRCEACQ